MTSSRRRWLVVGSLFLIAVWLVAIGNTRDELDFLRDYPHEEVVTPADVAWARSAHSWSSAKRMRIFMFHEVSLELFAELKKRSNSLSTLGRMEIVFPSGRKATFRHSSPDSSLVFLDEPPPTWLAQQWAGVRERIGMLSSHERAELSR